VIGLLIALLCIGGDMMTRANYEGQRSVPTSSFDSWWDAAPLLIVIAISGLILGVVGVSYWYVWIVLLCGAILVFLTVWRAVVSHVDLSIQVSSLQRIGITTLVLFGAILVAITHRPDPDDAQYLNFVVTAIDFPTVPLYSHSGLWQDLGVPLELPIYRLHAYELLVATLSEAFSVDHKIIYYMILAPMFGGMAILVQWRLAQHLIPQHALAMVVVWLVLIIALGQTHREFGNFAFVRLYQGKSILVTVALPLCLLLGLQFAEAPDWRRALALGMAAISSLGMSSSALATVPFVVAAALCGGVLGASRASIALVVTGAFFSLAVLIAVGVALVMGMNTPSEIGYWDSGLDAHDGLSTVLGEDIVGTVVLALFPLASLFVTDVRRRRLYATTTLFFVIFVLNPWTAPLLSEVLDSALLWRIFWSVPFLVSASICITALAVLAANKLPPIARHTVLPLLLGTVLLCSSGLSISPDNNVFIGYPRYKMEPFSHEIAEEIVRHAPPRSTIYAPIEIAKLITTFRKHPYPIVVRPEYLGFERIRSHFGDSELARRIRVIEILEGVDKQSSTAEFFQAQLASDRPTIVTYETKVEMAPVIGASLKAAGYVGEKRGIYWLWHRR